jgi:hypothetical protein
MVRGERRGKEEAQFLAVLFMRVAVPWLSLALLFPSNFHSWCFVVIRGVIC